MKNYPVGSKLKNSGFGQIAKKKETVMMLHGTASNGNQWSLLAIQLRQQYRVLTPDIPGYDKLYISTKLDLNWLDCRIKPLLRLIDRTEGKMHLVGHSFGGLVAMRLSELRPNRMGSVTIYEPTIIEVFKNCRDPNDLKLVAEVKQLAELVANSSPEAAMESFINYWHGENHWSTIDRDMKNKISKYSHIAAKDFLNGLEDLYQPQKYPYFQGNVNVLYGANTVPLAKRIAAKLLDRLPTANLFELAGLGHMGPITAPKKFNETVVAILELSLIHI